VFSSSACNKEDRTFVECITVESIEDKCSDEYLYDTFNTLLESLNVDQDLFEAYSVQYWQIEDDKTVLSIQIMKSNEDEFTNIESAISDFELIIDALDNNQILVDVSFYDEPKVILGFDNDKITGILVFNSTSTLEDLNSHSDFIIEFVDFDLFTTTRIQIGSVLTPDVTVDFNNQELTYNGDTENILYTYLLNEYTNYLIIIEE
jgi:hypothetical protein